MNRKKVALKNVDDFHFLRSENTFIGTYIRGSEAPVEIAFYFSAEALLVL